MKRLLLIRHAKSSWKHEDLDDHERPLNKRGERDVITMARHLANLDESLDVIYSSTATRALDFAQVISDFTHTTFIPDLSFYTFRADELLEIVSHIPDSAERVAIVGHNPAITQLANRLLQSEVDDEISKVPTSGMVALDCPVDSWVEITDIGCELSYFHYPKMLR